MSSSVHPESAAAPAAADSASHLTTSGRLPIVAIDGPAGAGKSTVAGHLARHFGLLNLETGAMYRAFALKAIASGVGLEDVPALVELSAHTTIDIEPGASGNRVFLDGEEITGRLRESGVTDGASRVSVHPPIRAWMVRLQQKLGEKGGIVMEGRDIGTVVFPNADVKIFLDADSEVRGLRRFDQIGGPSHKPPVSHEEIIRDIRARDERDRNRAESPLKAADDAIVLDSTHLTLAEVLSRAEEIVLASLAR
jgi:cytidylate kinase